MNKRIICSIIIIVVLILTVYTIFYRNHVQKVVTLYDACIVKCDSIYTNAQMTYQECLSLQIECNNFECLPNETPRECFERRREACRPLSICWQKYESLITQHKSCQTVCNNMVSILGN